MNILDKSNQLNYMVYDNDDCKLAMRTTANPEQLEFDEDLRFNDILRTMYEKINNEIIYQTEHEVLDKPNGNEDQGYKDECD